MGNGPYHGRLVLGVREVEFEHEILRERIRAGIAEARLKGRQSPPVTVGRQFNQIEKRGGGLLPILLFAAAKSA
jgi:DNA invertase Pin-like site-specific DNA recombinase